MRGMMLPRRAEIKRNIIHMQLLKQEKKELENKPYLKKIKKKKIIECSNLIHYKRQAGIIMSTTQAKESHR